MNLGLIKSGIQLATGFGVGAIVDEAVKLVKPNKVVGLKKAAVKLGGFVISMMVADKATDYVGEMWDKTAEGIKDFKVIPKKEVTEEEVEA